MSSSLNADQLAYVVTHAELLVMLSLRRMEAALDAGPDVAPPSDQELADAEAATLAELARQQQHWLAQPGGELLPVAATQVIPAPVDALPASAIDLGPEIDEALARAYADVPARAQALQGVDAARLAPALAALPEALPPLTQPLDAAGMAAWLDLHDAGDETLDQVLAEANAAAGAPE